MTDDNKTAVRPKRERMARSSKATTIKDDTAGRDAVRQAYRSKIESLLDKAADEQLADVWQRTCPFAVDPAHELPDRRGLIEDLADFAEVLHPNLDGMQARRLCRLVEKYAAYQPPPSDLPVSRPARPAGTRNCRGRKESRSEPVATLRG